MSRTKTLRILYVCPFAHRLGHYSWAAVHETYALKKVGLEVTLLTFAGVRDEEPHGVQHLSVIPLNETGLFSNFTRYYLQKACAMRSKLVKWPLLLSEYLSTLILAILLRKRLKFNVIHLRDGDPFLFLPLLSGLFVRNVNWVISLLGVSLANRLYSNLSRPILKLSLSKNHFIFVCQNEAVKEYYETRILRFLHGLPTGRIVILPPGLEQENHFVSLEEARRHLKLPFKKIVLLSFGTVHAGRDLDCVFKAIKNAQNVILLQAGGILPGNLKLDSLAQKYGLEDRVIIKDTYIPEADKPYYFSAADAIILSYVKSFSQTASILWEACRFHRPVIASNNSELGEFVRKYGVGLVFRAQDSLSLQDAINRFISLSSEELEKMKRNSEHFCDYFSFEKWAQRCLKIYEDTVYLK